VNAYNQLFIPVHQIIKDIQPVDVHVLCIDPQIPSQDDPKFSYFCLSSLGGCVSKSYQNKTHSVYIDMFLLYMNMIYNIYEIFKTSFGALIKAGNSFQENLTILCNRHYR